MKKLLSIIMFLVALSTTTAYAQMEVQGSDGGLSPVASAPYFLSPNNISARKVETDLLGKGLYFPRVDLSQVTEFGISITGPSPIPPTNRYSTYLDGLVVYNIGTGTTINSAIGKLEGELIPGFWYYDNSNPTGETHADRLIAGTWRPLGGIGGSAWPEGLCIYENDCDGDGYQNEDGDGTDGNDNDPCTPVLGKLKELSRATSGSSTIITIDHDGDPTLTVNNLSIDGGNSFVAGNSITVSPRVTTTYIIRANNCGNQVIAVTVEAILPELIVTSQIGVPEDGVTLTITRPDGWTDEQWEALGADDNFTVTIDDVEVPVTIDTNLDGTKTIVIAGDPDATEEQEIVIEIGGKVNGTPLAEQKIEIGLTATPKIAGFINGSDNNTLTATFGVPITTGNTFTLEYETITGGSALITDGMVFATKDGMSVVADGAQALPGVPKEIKIKVIGAPTAEGTTELEFTIGTAPAKITVTVESATGTIGSFSTPTLSSTDVTEGQPANITGTVAYSGKTGGDIVLTDGQELGTTADGLKIVADGDQTLSTPDGTVAFKIVGNPTKTGPITVSGTVGGKPFEALVNSSAATGAIGSLGACSLNGASVVAGAGVNMGGTLGYSGKTGADITLTDGDVLGSANGMQVVVDGNQTLSAGSGNINVKLIGTPTGSGNAAISLSTENGGSTSISVNVIADITAIPAGDAIFSGITCYDIAETPYDNTECGVFATRQQSKHYFNDDYALKYTFKPNVNVTNVSFTFVNHNQSSVSVVTGLTNADPGNVAANATHELTVNFNRNLNTQAKGKNKADAPTATLYVIFTYNGTQYQKSITVTVQDCACCGAMIDGGKWLTFACHNLGADISLDPMNPNYNNAGGKGLHGAKYKFGNKTPVLTMAQDQSNAGANPTGTWSSANPHQASGDWNPANDPCTHELGGSWRLPSQSEWAQVIKTQNNNISYHGNWTAGNDNYSSGLKVGDRLFLPAAGWRVFDDGRVYHRGYAGAYWSSTQNSGHGHNLSFYNGYTSPAGDANRTYGFSVRCVAD